MGFSDILRIVKEDDFSEIVVNCEFALVPGELVMQKSMFVFRRTIDEVMLVFCAVDLADPKVDCLHLRSPNVKDSF